MTEREILKLLKENGWYIEEGSKHHLATNPSKPGIKNTNTKTPQGYPDRNRKQHTQGSRAKISPMPQG